MDLAIDFVCYFAGLAARDRHIAGAGMVFPVIVMGES